MNRIADLKKLSKDSTQSATIKRVIVQEMAWVEWELRKLACKPNFTDSKIYQAREKRWYNLIGIYAVVFGLNPKEEGYTTATEDIRYPQGTWIKLGDILA